MVAEGPGRARDEQRHVHHVLGIGARAPGRRALHVAEGAQLLRRLGIGRAAALRLARRADRAVEPLLQPRHDVGMRGGDVAGFGRIGGEVVELRPRRPDVFVSPVAPGAEVAPAEVEARGQRLRVERLRGRALDESPQRLAGEHRPARSHGLDDGGRDVGEAHRRGDPAARRPTRTAHEQRHVERRVVDEQAVALFAVLAEGLAVIGGEDHDRRLGPRVPGRHERRDGGIRGRDFAAVGIRPAEGRAADRRARGDRRGAPTRTRGPGGRRARSAPPRPRRPRAAPRTRSSRPATSPSRRRRCRTRARARSAGPAGSRR